MKNMAKNNKNCSLNTDINLSNETQDVANTTPRLQIPIERVGVSAIKMPVKFKISGKLYDSFVEFEVYVNVPTKQRGINASRHYVVLRDVVNKWRNKDADISDICREASKDLLKAHEYSSIARVKFSTKINMPRSTLISKLPNDVTYELKGYVRATKTSNKLQYEHNIQVVAYGISACPCAQETIREIYLHALSTPVDEVQKIKKYLTLTHTQRVRSSVSYTTENKLPDIHHLIDVLDMSFSSPTQHLLKRKDEAYLVIHSAENPKFCEDIFREIVHGFCKIHKSKIHKNDKLSVKVVSYESIHPHDMIATGEFSGTDLKIYCLPNS